MQYRQRVAALYHGVAGEARGRGLHPQPHRTVCTGARRLVYDNVLLVRIVARRTGDAPPRYERHNDTEVLLGLFHIREDLVGRFDEEVVSEELTRHRRMAPPAEKADISPEFHVLGSVYGRVRYGCMAQETDRFIEVRHERAGSVSHDMGVDLRILLSEVAFETDLSSVRIRAASQELRWL